MFRGGIGAPEIILILVVLVLLFGAKKLPDLARGVGRSLKIFKAETKGLREDGTEEGADTAPGASTATPAAPRAVDQAPTAAPTATPPSHETIRSQPETERREA